MMEKIVDKLDPESALAQAINKIIDPSSASLKRRNSYISSGMPGPASQIMALEKLHVSLAGIPDGWDVPLFNPVFPLTEIIQNVIEMTPSIRGKESEGNREMIASLAKRAPPLNTALQIPSIEEGRIDVNE